MLLRNENEIEIRVDTIKKGTGRNCIILGLAIMILLTILGISMNPDFSIIETYFFIAMLALLPSSFFFIAGIIFIIKEKNPNRIVAKVNKDFVEIYAKKENKKINLKTITKINKVSSSLGTFLVIFYTDNKKEQKYSFAISPANKNLLVMAIQEFNNNIIINDFHK